MIRKQTYYTLLLVSGRSQKVVKKKTQLHAQRSSMLLKSSVMMNLIRANSRRRASLQLWRTSLKLPRRTLRSKVNQKKKLPNGWRTLVLLLISALRTIGKNSNFTWTKTIMIMKTHTLLSKRAWNFTTLRQLSRLKNADCDRFYLIYCLF